jgi:hypothetical protein
MFGRRLVNLSSPAVRALYSCSPRTHTLFVTRKPNNSKPSTVATPSKYPLFATFCRELFGFAKDEAMYNGLNERASYLVENSISRKQAADVWEKHSDF